METAELAGAALAWAFFVMALAGLVHGALGLGFPLVATPLLALVTDIKTAIVLILAPTLAAIVVSIVRSGRPAAILAEYWSLPIYMMIGSFLGARLLIAADPAPFTLLLALMIVAYLNMERMRGAAAAWVRAHPQVARASFGLVAGVFESTANVAAPPLLIYFLSLGLAPAALVQALNLCFLAGKSTQAATLTAAGGLSASFWISTLPFAAVGVAALMVGISIRSRVDANTYRRWLRRALTVIAAVLVAQFAWTMASNYQ